MSNTLRRTKKNLQDLLPAPKKEEKIHELLKVVNEENLEGHNREIASQAWRVCKNILATLVQSSPEIEEKLGEMEVIFSSDPNNLSSHVISQNNKTSIVINLEMIKKCQTQEEVAGVLALALGYQVIANTHYSVDQQQQTITSEQKLKATSFATKLLLKSGYGIEGLINLLTDPEQERESQNRSSRASYRSRSSSNKSKSSGLKLVTYVNGNADENNLEELISGKTDNLDDFIIRTIQNTAVLYKRNGGSVEKKADQKEFNNLKSIINDFQSETELKEHQKDQYLDHDSQEEFEIKNKIKNKITEFLDADSTQKASEIAEEILKLNTKISSEAFKKTIKEASPEVPTGKVIIESEITEIKKRVEAVQKPRYLNLINRLNFDDQEIEKVNQVLVLMNLHKDPYVAQKIGDESAVLESAKFMRSSDNQSFEGLNPDYYPSDISSQIKVGTENEVKEISEINNDIYKARIDISRTNEEIDDLEQQIKEGTSNEKKNKLKNLKTLLTKLKTDLDNHFERLIENNVYLKNLDRKISEIETQKAKGNLNAKELELLNKRLKSLKSRRTIIKSRLVKKQSEEASHSKAQEKFLDGNTFVLRSNETEIESQREKLDEVVFSITLGNKKFIRTKKGIFYRRLPINRKIARLEMEDRENRVKSMIAGLPKTSLNSLLSFAKQSNKGEFDKASIKQQEKLVAQEISIKKRERLGQEIDLIRDLNRLSKNNSENDGWNLLRSNPKKFIALYGLYLCSSYIAGKKEAPFADKFFREVSKLLKDESKRQELEEILKTLFSIKTNTGSKDDNHDVLSYAHIASHYDAYDLTHFKEDHPAITFLRKGNLGFEIIGEDKKLAFLLKTKEFIAEESSSFSGVKLSEYGKQQLKQFLRFPNSKINSVQELLGEIKAAQDSGKPYHQAVIDIMAEELINSKSDKIITRKDLLALSNIISTRIEKQNVYANSFGNLHFGNKGGRKVRIPYIDFELNIKLKELQKKRILQYVDKADSVSTSNLINDYKEFNAYGWFENVPEAKTKLLEKIKQQISFVEADEKIKLLESLLKREKYSYEDQKDYIYDGIIENHNIREWAIEEFAKLESKKLKGKKDGEITERINELKKSLSPQIFPNVATIIADQIDANEKLANHIRDLCESQDGSEFVKKSSEEQELANSLLSEFGIKINDINDENYDAIRSALHDFLLNPVSNDRINNLFDALKTKLEERINSKEDSIPKNMLPKELREKFEEELKKKSLYQFKIAHENFWKMSSEQRMAIVDLLSFPACNENQYEQHINYIIGSSFDSINIDENSKILARSILKSYANQLELNERRLLAVAIEVATAKQNENEKATSVGKQLALIFSYLGPAGTKLAQAVSSYSGTPDNIKKDLETFKTNASPLKRWEVLRLLAQDNIKVGETLKIDGKDKKIEKIGHVAGSGSLGITAFIMLEDKTEVAVTVLRENAEKMVNREFKLMKKAISSAIDPDKDGKTPAQKRKESAEKRIEGALNKKEDLEKLLDKAKKEKVGFGWRSRMNYRKNLRSLTKDIKEQEENIKREEENIKGADQNEKTAKAIGIIIDNADRAFKEEVNMQTAEKQNVEAEKTYGSDVKAIKTKVRVFGKNYIFTNHVANFYGFTKNAKICEKVPGDHFNDLPTATKQDRDFKRAAAKAIIAAQLTAIFQGKAVDIDRHGGNIKIGKNEGGKFTLYHFDFGMMQTEPATPEQQRALGIILARIYRARGQGKSVGDLLQNEVKEFIDEMKDPDKNPKSSAHTFSTENQENIQNYLNDFVKGMLALGDEMNSMKKSVLIGVFARVLNSENVKGTEVKKAFDEEVKMTWIEKKKTKAAQLLSNKISVKSAAQLDASNKGWFK